MTKKRTQPTTEDLACVRCLGALKPAGNALQCTSCSSTFPAVYGILDFRVKRPGYFFNPVSADRMEPLVEEAASGSWERAIRRFVEDARRNTGWLDNLVVDGRYAWKLLLDLRPESKVLDFGCGLGNLAHNVAPLVQRVYALDLTYSRLRFSRARFDRFNSSDQVVTMAAGDGQHLPFGDGVLDCVLVCGVLEWMGEGDLSPFEEGGKALRLVRMIGYQYGARGPRRMQLDFLREVRRILKPSGQLFVAIENRLNHEYFAGRRDHHSMLYGGSLLPRSIANLYSIAVNRKPYRTYTYSVPGYRKLMREAGFPNVEFLGLTPGYSVLEEILPAAVDAANWRPDRPSRLKDRVKGSKYFVPAYGMICSAKPMPWPRREDGMLRAIEQRLRESFGSAELVRHRYVVSGKQKLIIHASYGTRRIIIRIPLNVAALKTEQTNARLLAQLAHSRVSRSLHPEALASGEVAGLWYSVEEELDGEPLAQALAREGRTSRLSGVAETLDQLARAAPPGAREVRLVDEMYDQHVQAWLSEVIAVVDDIDLANAAVGFFRSQLYGAKTTVGITHGDFSVRNIFVRDDGTMGLIDWGDGTLEGLPILDVINYLASVHVAFHPNDSLVNVVPALASGRWSEPRETEFLYSRLAALGLDNVAPAQWVYLAWLRGMSQRLGNTMRFDPVSIEREVIGGLKAILGASGAPSEAEALAG